MVQTEQQYICIHQCLMAVLEGKENVINPPREIHDNPGYEGKRDLLLWRLLFLSGFGGVDGYGQGGYRKGGC